MPLTVKKQGDKWIVTDPSGKNFGSHPSKQKAIDQLAAIEMSKKRRGKSALDLVAEDRITSLAAELEIEDDADEHAPIMIVSDGSPEGTTLMVNGVPINAKRINLYCSKDEDYPNCDLSITIEESGPDGLRIEKTLTLRKEPSDAKYPSLKGAKKPKLDPNAKVRNRGDVVFPSTHAKVTDNKDHFPINDADQARNALSRVAQYSAAPSWWSGSLKQLQAAVRSAVKRKFKDIKVTD